MRKIDGNFAEYEHNFNDPKCHPPHNIDVAFCKQIDKHGEEFWLTISGEWDGKDVQHDLTFKDKKEAIQFVKGFIALIKEPYGL